MRATTVFALLLLILSVAFAAPATQQHNIYQSLVIDDVTRNIDATKPNIVRHSIILKVVNSGEKVAEYFHLALPKEFGRKHLSYLRVKQDDRELQITNYGYEDKQQSDAVFYEVQLAKPLQPKQKIELNVFMTLTNGITTAYPKEIAQNENQKLLYIDDAYFYSPYSISNQKTSIDLGTSNIESFTNEIKPTERRGSTIIFGPYLNQKPYAYQKVRLHYQNNLPYVVVSKVNRHVEISHWGNIAVEESYDVRHGGAKFKGEFSRSEYARNPSQTSPATFRTLTAKLPPTAADVYFRDRIGNISTSTVRPSSKNVEVDFLPRFPLFGGWRIRFTIGYNLPTAPFLRSSGDKYELRTKFSIPFDFAPVDDLTLKIVIPEGAQDIKVQLPFQVDSESRENLKTYLDVTGRSVVILKKTNLSPEHNQDVIVTYTFPSTAILQEPLLVIGGLFAFCLFMILYVRLDLTIQKSEAQIAEEKEQTVIELVELFVEKQLQVNTLYTTLEQAIQRVRDPEASIFEDAVKQISATRADLVANISDIAKKLRELNAQDPATKIANIQAHDETKFNVIQQLASTKKNALKKGSHSEVAKAIQPFEKQYDNASEELNRILDQLSE